MGAQAWLVVEIVRLGLGALLVTLGFACIAGGTLGMLRFPDFYTRLHAQRVADAIGVVIVILGLALACLDAATAIKLVLLAVLVAALSPLIAQLNAHAAHAAGLAPIAGPYVAPRPGANSGATPREDSAP